MNHFAAAARAKKVARMLALLDSQAPCRTVTDAARTADWLESLIPSQRCMLATAAGVNAPSSATWTAFVAAARARMALAVAS